MGQLFDELCKGPVVVIDDQIGNEDDPINKLITEIKDANLPVLCYKSLDEARSQLCGLSFSNFVILDWRFLSSIDQTTGVLIGAEAETVNAEEVTKLIKELQKSCLAPIFVISALDKDGILARLKDAGISTQEKACVFVENKGALCETPGKLISTIEEWIAKSPHVYLAKAWTNEWNSKNTSVFWDLYELNSEWPALFYRTFESRGEDPILGLRDILLQLISSEIDVSKIATSYLAKETGTTEPESLKDLYRRIVYTTRNIERDIRPGDIFKTKEGTKRRYYLNIRPECDTTKPQEGEDVIMMYLLEGQRQNPEDYEKRYDRDRGQIVPWQNEIFLFHLDNHPLVRFDKKKLIIKAYSEIKEKKWEKICRVVPPFITQIQQSYSNYISRFGIPSYPREILDLVFPQEQTL